MRLKRVIVNATINHAEVEEMCDDDSFRLPSIAM
jgi:hypothetical protein